MTDLDQDLQKLKKSSEFIAQLNSQVFKNFLKQRINNLTSNPVIFQKRNPVPNKPLAMSPANHSPVALYYSSSGKLKTQLDYLASYPGEPDYFSTNLYHDGVIVGGIISALAQEFLLGIPTKSTTINYAFYSRTTKAREVKENEIVLNEEAFAYHPKKEFSVEGINFIHISEPERNKPVKWLSLLFKQKLNCEAICYHPLTQEVTFLPEFLQFLVDESREVKIIKQNSSISLGTVAYAKTIAEDFDANFYLGDAVRNIIITELDDPSEGWGVLKNILEEELVKLYPIQTGKVIENNQLKSKEFSLLENRPNVLMPYFSYNPESQTLISYVKFPLIDYLRFLTKKSSWLLAKKNRILNWHCLKEVMKIIKPQYPAQEVESKYYQRLLTLMQGFEVFYSVELNRPFNKVYLISQERNHAQIRKVANFIKNDIQEEAFMSLLEKIKGHSVLFAAMLCFLDEGWTFAQTDLFLRNLSNLGLTEIGAFENFIAANWQANITHKTVSNHGLLCDFNSKKFKQTVLFKDHSAQSLLVTFKEMMEEWQEVNREKNTLRPPRSLGVFKNKVKELVLSTELSIEGKRMSHCVGGYSEKVRSRQCRIFHLEHQGEKATLEVLMDAPSSANPLGLGDILLIAQRMEREQDLKERRRSDKDLKKNKPSGYSLGQLKSFANGEPSLKMKHLAKLFIHYLNLYQKSELPSFNKEKKK